ncbi:hypothetical protein HD554DRAFT_448329 [Boletus coccyginus]|nr:hypothetical protein HD554DRAFT_448329 [Boletus coccyginus]
MVWTRSNILGGPSIDFSRLALRRTMQFQSPTRQCYPAASNLAPERKSLSPMSSTTAHQHNAHALLVCEMLIVSLSMAGLVVFGFRWLDPQAASHVHLGRCFAFLAGMSVLTLLSSVVVVVRRLKGCEGTWRLLFHLPFFLVMTFLGHTALQESSYSFPKNLLAPAGSLAFGMPAVYAILGGLYDNMMSALKGDQAGPFFLDYVYRWITTALVSAICAIRQRRSPGSTRSFEIGQRLGSVKIWFSDLVHTQHIQVWPDEESAEESKILLSHDV